MTESKKRKTKKEKEVVGLVDDVIVRGEKGEVKVKALYDTGATRTSVDEEIVEKVGLKDTGKTVLIKSKTSPKGYVKRKLYEAEIEVRGKKFNVVVNATRRSDMAYPVLIGRDIIHNNFIIDVSLTHKSNKVKDLRE